MLRVGSIGLSSTLSNLHFHYCLFFYLSLFSLLFCCHHQHLYRCPGMGSFKKKRKEVFDLLDRGGICCGSIWALKLRHFHSRYQQWSNVDQCSGFVMALTLACLMVRLHSLHCGKEVGDPSLVPLEQGTSGYDRAPLYQVSKVSPLHSMLSLYR